MDPETHENIKQAQSELDEFEGIKAASGFRVKGSYSLTPVRCESLHFKRGSALDLHTTRFQGHTHHFHFTHTKKQIFCVCLRSYKHFKY